MAGPARGVRSERNFSPGELKRAVLRGARDALNDVARDDVLEPARQDAPIGGPETESGRRRRHRGELHPGHLRASGRIDRRARAEPGQLLAVVGFHAVYAAKQHEELDWIHPHGGRAKYLEIHLIKISALILKVKVALQVHAELEKLRARG